MTRPRLAGKTIVFEGTLEMDRDEATARALAAGASVEDKLRVLHTDILVVGAGDPWRCWRKEAAAAEEEGVEVWTEQRFAEKVGGSSGEYGGRPTVGVVTRARTAGKRALVDEPTTMRTKAKPKVEPRSPGAWQALKYRGRRRREESHLKREAEERLRRKAASRQQSAT